KKEDDRLQEWKSLYNQVVDALHDLEISQRIDPVGRLPSEILTKILLELRNGRHITKRFDDLFMLTMVSTKWRNYILSEPHLWNSIILFNQSDMHAKTSLQLILSRDLPLTVEVTFPLNGWEYIKRELIQHRGRIEAILSHQVQSLSSTPRIEGQTNNLWAMLNDLGSLPNLRKLADASPKRTAFQHLKKTLDSFPSLEDITDFSISSHDLRMAKDRMRTSTLTTWEDLKTLFPVIRTIKSLKKVRFLSRGGNTTQNRPRVAELETDLISRAQSSLGWTEVACFRREDIILSPILSLLPSLVILEISIYLQALNNIANLLPGLSKLLHIRLHLRLTPDDHVSVVQPLALNMGVQSLKIRIFRLTESGPGTWTALTRYIQLANNIDRISLMLLHIMPKLKDLSLSIEGVQQPFPFFSGNEVFARENLHLSFYGSTVIPNPDVRIPLCVKKLELSCPVDLVGLLSSKSVKYLSYKEVKRRKLPLNPSEDCMFDPNNWPVLEHIEIMDSM
ncbi:10289_t:CDS:1, partial [Acaulospora colombiana]